MIINRVSMDAVFTNFRADYEAGILAAKSAKDRIAMTVNSAAKEETYGWLGNSNSLREWVGQKVVRNLVTTGFSIKTVRSKNQLGPHVLAKDRRLSSSLAALCISAD
ncbi:MAG TPA: Mu-like prophage major head subunit gpT family protein [Rhodocyclaceae bacterium]|mgnify:CR=1 FL=1|jgi:phage major head subunit gpT-like protein|nr:Mu-like prophage major head subunit gpT family protein [Rhodocyclaceae bacterium]